jgi:integrase
MVRLRLGKADGNDQTQRISRLNSRNVDSLFKGQAAPASTLADLLKAWRTNCEFEWVFANPATCMPYQSLSMQQRWIPPAGEAIGVEGLGFHSLRHSYRFWLDSAGIAPGVTKD